MYILNEPKLNREKLLYNTWFHLSRLTWPKGSCSRSLCVFGFSNWAEIFGQAHVI